jgi:3-oxoacyl-[acyl-carrier-protein] synthase-1
MHRHEPVAITGTGAVCGAGFRAADVLGAVEDGRSTIAPIRAWSAAAWPTPSAAEVPEHDPGQLIGDRKLLKLIRRTDVFGLYAAAQAVEGAGLAAHRAGLDGEASERLGENTGVYVGSGGGTYQDQYDFFPLLTAADGSLEAFGRQLGDRVNPMWLLRSLPNNVLCHVGIRHGFKGPNACITNHCTGGVQAVIEAMEALRAGECDRAIALAHDTPIEPQTTLYYHHAGLLAEETLRPFDAGRSGSVLGEGAAALFLETPAAAAERQAPVLGHLLGAASATEAEGLLPVRSDGDGLARVICLALENAGIGPEDVGMIVAHGNGTARGDASEARAIRAVFGAAAPPITAFKWAFGHLLAAAGVLDTVVAFGALAGGTVPGVATLRCVDPEFAELPITSTRQPARSDVGLILSRGFAATNAALVVRGGLN